MSTKFLLVLLLVIFYSSCIEEYNPKLDNYNNLIVVDGEITNEEGPYTVILRVSSNLDYYKNIYIKGAKVIIEAKSGVRELLTEVSPGVYITAKNGIRGRIGEEYRLIIQNGNKTYKSEFAELKKPIEISSISSDIENHVIKEENVSFSGYQFYVSSGVSVDSINYFAWFLNATYKLETNLPIELVYEGYFHKPKFADTLKTCYVSYNLNQFYTGTTSNLIGNRIIKKPLVFVPTNDDKLRIRYSLQVKQYTFDKNAFNFWKQIEKINSSNSSLYNSQPFQVKGNLKNLDDENEAVLGYFTVAGVSSKRVFVDNPIIYESRDCSVGVEKVFEFISISDKSDWPIYLTRNKDGVLGIADGVCIDCTSEKGAELKKPWFWID